MTKTILILAIILTGFGTQSAYAAGCAEEDIQHWNKIVFEHNLEFVHPTLENIFPFESPHEVLVQVDPNAVHQPRQLVAIKLNELGYFLPGEPQIEDFNIDNTLDIEYSTICGGTGIMAVVGGLLIQPDTATLVLAYGIANSIWIVPSVAGIGIAVYLTKNRLQKH